MTIVLDKDFLMWVFFALICFESWRDHTGFSALVGCIVAALTHDPGTAIAAFFITAAAYGVVWLIRVAREPKQPDTLEEWQQDRGA